MHSLEQTIHELESKLISAMVASDVATLDALIDDHLIFIGPDGKSYSKQEDLLLHSTGQMQIEYIQLEERVIKLHGTTAIVMTIAILKGALQGNAFLGRFKYLRTWHCENGTHRIIAGSVCSLPAS